jgi:hypothetical protein
MGCVSIHFAAPLTTKRSFHLSIVSLMNSPLAPIAIEPDAHHVSRDSIVLAAKLSAAIAVCIHDDTQGVGGLLHLRYLAGSTSPHSVDLTDNTLSSDLLLLDRFCKDLRTNGARKQSWRVRIVGHLPTTNNVDIPAASLLDLLRAYFADNRVAAEYKEIRAEGALLVRLNAREGALSVTKASS